MSPAPTGEASKEISRRLGRHGFTEVSGPERFSVTKASPMKWAPWIAASIAAAAVARRFTHRWGATSDEHATALPGDELVAAPALIATRAVTIDAPPERVWAWLIQIGQNRGGMYSYDWLENLLGLDIHSTHEIRDEWQHPAPGERIVLVPPGFAGLEDGYTLPIERIEPPRTLVLRQAPPEHPFDAVWSFHIKPAPGGRSRLISRSRSRRHGGARGAAEIALDTIMDPITWMMTRKMLLTIARRAEASATNTTPSNERHATKRPPNRWDTRTRRRLSTDLQQLGIALPTQPGQPVNDADLEPLPEPAQRYLRWMGVVGRPRDLSFHARFVGQFRMRPDQKWMPFHAWQVNTSAPVTRLIRMRIDLAGIVPMFGTDTYAHHTGRMHGKLMGLISVADGEGPEFDLGELVTYVNDAALIAPSMLLTPACQWITVDDHTFDLVFTDEANTVRARLTVDDDGRLLGFCTEDRWYAGTSPPTRTRWTTPIDSWTSLQDGRPVPAFAAATWHLADGDFTYVRGRFDPANITFGN